MKIHTIQYNFFQYILNKSWIFLYILNLFQFLKYIVSHDVQKELTLKLGWNPCRKDIYLDNEVIQKMPHFVELQGIFENAYPRPMLPFYTLISEILQRRISGVLSGKVSLDEALARAEEEAQKIVQRYQKIQNYTALSA